MGLTCEEYVEKRDRKRVEAAEAARRCLEAEAESIIPQIEQAINQGDEYYTFENKLLISSIHIEYAIEQLEKKYPWLRIEYWHITDFTLHFQVVDSADKKYDGPRDITKARQRQILERHRQKTNTNTNNNGSALAVAAIVLASVVMLIFVCMAINSAIMSY